jgi:tetratricopeptide (TPR) repeat protein
MKGSGWRRLHKRRITAVFLLALFVLSSAGAQDNDLAEAQRLIGQVSQYYAKGQYQQAIPLAQRALAIREKALGPEHPDTGTALNNLAELYRAAGDYANAEPLFQRALAISEKALGAEHPETAILANRIAISAETAGEAEPIPGSAPASQNRPQSSINRNHRFGGTSQGGWTTVHGRPSVKMRNRKRRQASNRPSA